jgi:hypothetical protein
MKTLDLGSYLAGVRARKAMLLPDGAGLAIDTARNGGARRTTSKREALALAEARAKAVGVTPVPSNN